MSIRFTRVISLAAALALLLGAVAAPVNAQGESQRYDSRAMGVAFDLPAGWIVSEGENKLLAAVPDDVALVEQGGIPNNLALRIVTGTFNQLGIVDATQLPELLARLVPSPDAPAPAQVEIGNASGYQVEVTLPEEGITTRVALLAIAGGRVAIVRGLAPPSVWSGGASAQLDALTQSLAFSLPERDENYLENILANDGGVLWHYQEPQPGNRTVMAGGVVYDQFDVMYVVAGTGGIVSLQEPTGDRISYMGPWQGGDFVDVAIGPDTKLYMANVAADTQFAIAVVDRAGNWLRGWGARGDADGQFAPDMPQTIAVTASNEVWTVSEGHSSGIRNRLYHFDAFGNLLQTIDLDTINENLSGVRIDNNISTGGLYIVGATGNLNVVDAHGEPLVVNLAQEVLNGLSPVDIAIAPNGNIILALAAPGLDGRGFLELSVSGKLLDVFGIPYDETRSGPFQPGEYLNPAGLIVGTNGTVYWTETNPATGYTQVQAFTFSGDGRLPLANAGEGSVDAPVEAVGALDPALGGGTIVFGQTVQGSLNNRYPSHQWTFEGRAGEHVIITMRDATGANQLDPQLSLQRSDGFEIAANDDVGDVRPEALTRRDALIDYFLPDTGLYLIQAGRFGGRGEYILTLELVQ